MKTDCEMRIAKHDGTKTRKHEKHENTGSTASSAVTKTGFTVLFLSVALCGTARNGAAQAAVFPSHDVRIEVTVNDDGRAAVNEEYVLTGPAEATFEFLDNPCSHVGPISAQLAGRTTVLSADADTRRPWTVMRISLTDGPAPVRVWGVRYDVQMDGDEALVPIVLPAATLERADGSRGADVTLDVGFSGAAGTRVLMPQLQAMPDNHWHGRLLAIPSFVRVRTPARGGSCSRPIDGTTGGLEWRFAIFVGTMVIWVPVYLSWFARRRKP
jgi:hypothetical protein